jgi:hypothetical protein
MCCCDLQAGQSEGLSPATPEETPKYLLCDGTSLGDEKRAKGGPAGPREEHAPFGEGAAFHFVVNFPISRAKNDESLAPFHVASRALPPSREPTPPSHYAVRQR